MKKISWYLAKIKSKLFKNHEILVNYYRRGGCRIGQDCLICSDIMTQEPFLISIGDRCVISTDVVFVTHDYSISRVIPDKSNIYGRIQIGNNCFIGTRSVLMYGIELPDNVIVAAGSVVVNSFEDSNIVIAGNPARIVGTWDDMYKKYEDKATYARTINEQIKTNPKVLVRRKSKLLRR